MRTITSIELKCSNAERWSEHSDSAGRTWILGGTPPSKQLAEEHSVVNPFTRIALEAAALIIGFIVLAVVLAYLGGAFTFDSQ